MRLLPTSLVLAWFATPALASAHEGAGGNLGIGLGVGAPTGLSLEVSTARTSALELAIGVDTFDESGGYAHLVWKQNLARLTTGPTVVVPLYVGVGGFLFDQDRGFDDDVDLGVRLPIGVNFDFQRAPLQIFTELALNFGLLDVGDEEPAEDDDDTWIGVGGYLGARVWF
jgi:hypothetical protein